jgi:hypothetical protein
MCKSSHNWQEQEAITHHRSKVFTVSAVFMSISLVCAMMLMTNFIAGCCGKEFTTTCAMIAAYQ